MVAHGLHIGGEGGSMVRGDANVGGLTPVVGQVKDVHQLIVLARPLRAEEVQRAGEGGLFI